MVFVMRTWTKNKGRNKRRILILGPVPVVPVESTRSRLGTGCTQSMMVVVLTRLICVPLPAPAPVPFSLHCFLGDSPLGLCSRWRTACPPEMTRIKERSWRVVLGGHRGGRGTSQRKGLRRNASTMAEREMTASRANYGASEQVSKSTGNPMDQSRGQRQTHSTILFSVSFLSSPV